MSKLNTVIFDNVVPKTEKIITAVTSSNSGLLIQDYKNGKPVNNGGRVHNVAEVLKYDYKDKTVYLQKAVINEFSSLLEYAQAFDDAREVLSAFE